MKVYVVGFAPADDQAATGGFNWYPDEQEARAEMIKLMHDSPSPSIHSYTFVPLDLPLPNITSDEERLAVTAWIDEHLELIEVGRPS